MGKRKKDISEEKAYEYQRELGMVDSVSDEHIVARRMGFYDGYRQAKKEDIELAVCWLKKKIKEIYAGREWVGIRDDEMERVSVLNEIIEKLESL